jgi:hypothetical protein
MEDHGPTWGLVSWGSRGRWFKSSEPDEENTVHHPGVLFRASDGSAIGLAVSESFSRSEQKVNMSVQNGAFG